MTSKKISKSGSLRTGSLARMVLSLLKAWSLIYDHVKDSLFLVNWVSGFVMKACFWKNTLHQSISPKNPCTLDTLRGIDQLTMASTLAGSREIPSFETMNPR